VSGNLDLAEEALRATSGDDAEVVLRRALGRHQVAASIITSRR
jgi:hypothetical protein